MDNLSGVSFHVSQPQVMRCRKYERERRPSMRQSEPSERGQSHKTSDVHLYLLRAGRKPNCGRFPSRTVTRFLPLLILDVSRAIGVFVVSVDNPHISQNLSTSSSWRPHALQYYFNRQLVLSVYQLANNCVISLSGDTCSEKEVECYLENK